MNNNHPIREKFNSSLIKDTINIINLEIIKLKNLGKKDFFDFELHIMDIFPEFYQEYPFLIKKICKGEDISYLYKMLDNLDQVDKGEKSFTDVETMLGNELADTFIYTKIKKNEN